MIKGLYTAYTGMANEQRRMDVLTNNLANATTTGYKKEGMVAQSFDEKLAIKIKDTSYGRKLVKGIGDITFGVKVGETYTDWSTGSFQITDKPSDVAIAGNGFYAIEFTNKAGETSIKYTRDGAFTVDNEGYFRTVDGDYLLNDGGAMGSAYGAGNRVQIDPVVDYSIDKLGNVYQNGDIVATIGLVDFENYDYLTKYGENLYDLDPDGTIMAATGQFEQGVLESSNVSVVDEMVNMITIQRAYEADQKVIQTVDSTLDKAVNQVGKL